MPEPAEPQRSIESKAEPQRRATGIWTVLAILILALLAWLAFDRGLTTTQAWRNQIDDWWQSIDPSVHQSGSLIQPREQYGDITSVRSEPETVLPAEPQFVPEPESQLLPQLATQIELEPEREQEQELELELTQEPVEPVDPQTEVLIEPVPEQKSISEAPAAKVQIVFGFDSAGLSEEAKESLDEMSIAFISSGSSRIRVTGYADELGDRDYNFGLSRRRADAVAQYLVASGVAREFLDVQGLGIYSAAEEESLDYTIPGPNGRIVYLEVQAH